jgi:hypothetical protein
MAMATGAVRTAPGRAHLSAAARNQLLPGSKKAAPFAAGTTKAACVPPHIPRRP